MQCFEWCTLFRIIWSFWWNIDHIFWLCAPELACLTKTESLKVLHQSSCRCEPRSIAIVLCTDYKCFWMLRIYIFTNLMSMWLALIPPVLTCVMRECFIDLWHQLFTHVYRPDFFCLADKAHVVAAGQMDGRKLPWTWTSIKLHACTSCCGDARPPSLLTTLRPTTVRTLQWRPWRQASSEDLELQRQRSLLPTRRAARFCSC